MTYPPLSRQACRSPVRYPLSCSVSRTRRQATVRPILDACMYILSAAIAAGSKICTADNRIHETLRTNSINGTSPRPPRPSHLRLGLWSAERPYGFTAARLPVPSKGPWRTRSNPCRRCLASQVTGSPSSKMLDRRQSIIGLRMDAKAALADAIMGFAWPESNVARVLCSKCESSWSAYLPRELLTRTRQPFRPTAASCIRRMTVKTVHACRGFRSW